MRKEGREGRREGGKKGGREGEKVEDGKSAREKEEI